MNFIFYCIVCVHLAMSICPYNTTKQLYYKDQTQPSFQTFSMSSSVTSTGTAYPSGTSEVNPHFCKVHAAQSFVFCIMLDRSCFLFSLPLLFCLSVCLQIPSSGYSFDIFNECLCLVIWIQRDHNWFIVHVKLRLLSIFDLPNLAQTLKDMQTEHKQAIIVP